MDYFKRQVFFAQNEEQTEHIGQEFANVLKPGNIVALHGGMGVGKTAITRGIARGLGFYGRVTSPTYAIVNEYNGKIPIFHFDLFRLGSAEELYDIGFGEYLVRNGVLVIEWFEIAESTVQADYHISLSPVVEDENVRKIEIWRETEAES